MGKKDPSSDTPNLHTNLQKSCECNQCRLSCYAMHSAKRAQRQASPSARTACMLYRGSCSASPPRAVNPRDTNPPAVTHCCAGAAGAAGAAAAAAGAAACAGPLATTCSAGALSPRISLTSCTGGLPECCACRPMLGLVGVPAGATLAAGEAGRPCRTDRQTDRHRFRQTGRQAGRHTDGHIKRQISNQCRPLKGLGVSNQFFSMGQLN